MTAEPDLRLDPDERLRLTVEAVRQAVRRQNRTESPLGPKAVRTRRSLLEAAGQVFAEKGFVATTTLDITERAGTSLATFYQYFADVSSVVAVLAGEQIVGMLEDRVDDWDPTTGRLGVRRVVAAFVNGYLDNIDFYRLWEQASVTDPDVGRMRREFWSAYKHRIQRRLAEGMAAGVVRSRQPPVDLARALLHLLDRYCYDLTIGDPPAQLPEADDVIDFLTTVWVEALGLDETRPAPLRKPRPAPARAATTKSPSRRGGSRA